MVIEEVNFMQNHLEIEKTCRESAEALATKVSCVSQSCACWSSNELRLSCSISNSLPTHVL